MSDNQIYKPILRRFVQAVSGRHVVVDRLNRVGISITFDDGPHSKNTPRILEELKRRNIQASFFVLGSHLAKHRYLGDLLAKDGHEIGNHTFDHVDLNKHPFETFRRSVIAAERLISDYPNRNRLKFLRSPYGRISVRLILYVLMNGYTLVGWTVDSRDSFIRDPEELVTYCSRLKIDNGDILLFHEDYDHTVEALPAILDNLCERGLQFKRLEQLIMGCC